MDKQRQEIKSILLDHVIPVKFVNGFGVTTSEAVEILVARENKKVFTGRTNGVLIGAFIALFISAAITLAYYRSIQPPDIKVLPVDSVTLERGRRDSL